jgi:hypothetical protein
MRPDGQGAGALGRGVRLARQPRLPTPAPALTTIPRQSASPMASAIRPSSVSRPTSGHVAERDDVAAGGPGFMARAGL